MRIFSPVLLRLLFYTGIQQDISNFHMENVLHREMSDKISHEFEVKKAIFKDSKLPHWDYYGERGPENWERDFPVCGLGDKQSPLNIVGPFENSKDILAVTYKKGPLRILNNGHTIEVNVDPGNTLSVNNEVYNLLQFHFHRPSEEQLNGKSMAMVAHFVHKNTEGKLVVLGVLFNEGKTNEAVKTIFENAPKSEGIEVVFHEIEFNPSVLIPAALNHYSYEGSLTTPPCTEGINFYIFKTVMNIEESQLADFPFQHNARPVQPLNGRKISTH